MVNDERPATRGVIARPNMRDSRMRTGTGENNSPLATRRIVNHSWLMFNLIKVSTGGTRMVIEGEWC